MLSATLQSSLVLTAALKVVMLLAMYHTQKTFPGVAEAVHVRHVGDSLREMCSTHIVASPPAKQQLLNPVTLNHTLWSILLRNLAEYE